MADDETNETPGTGDAGGADETQAGWAAPGQAPREPAAPASPAPGEQSQPPPPPPPEQTASAAWQAAPAAPRPPGPARRGGRKWLVVLVALLSVTVIMVIVGSVLFANRTLPPYHGAHDFLSDVIHGRASEAGARLCAADRENPERALSKVSSTFDGERSSSTHSTLTARAITRSSATRSICPGPADRRRTTFRCAKKAGTGWHARSPAKADPQPRLLDLGYASAGSVRTFTTDKPSCANARSSAGPMSAGSSTSSPCPPSTSATLS